MAIFSILKDSSDKYPIPQTGGADGQTGTVVTGETVDGKHGPHTNIIKTPKSSTGTVSHANVSAAATQIRAANANRKRIVITNKGSVRIWLGTTSGVTAGESGTNFGFLDEGDVWEEETWTGAVYGITESGTAYAGVLEIA